MEITKEDLKDRYNSLGNNELLDLYLSRSQYTAIAVEAMTEVIKSRGLTQEDLDAFLQHKVLEKDEMFQRENFKELIFLEKAVFYYLAFIILFFIFFTMLLAEETKKQGYIVKIRQAVLYVFSSLSILLFADWIFPEYELQIWAACFVIPLYFNSKSSKKRREQFDNIYGQAKIK
jgi:hypothetical protein